MAKRKKQQAEAYPKTLYVVRKEEEGSGIDPWLESTENALSLSEPDQTVEVAEYRLVGMRKVRNQTTVE